MELSLQLSNYSLKDKIENSFANLTLSDIGLNEKKDEINSILSNSKLEDLNNINNIITKKRQKLKKEELNNIPIPIFSCIYCSNEKVSFNHMINKILEQKYFLLTSLYDIKIINKLILNPKIPDLIKKDFEYIKEYFKYKDSQILLNKNMKSKKEIMNYNIKNKITNYSTCNNSTTFIKFKFEDLMKSKHYEKNKKSKNIIERKIKKKDIKWDFKYYNIWAPIPEPIFSMKNLSSNKIQKENKNMNINISNKINVKKNSKIKIITKEINKKKYNHRIPTNRNEKITLNKSFQKLITYTYNTTKKSSNYKNIYKINNNKNTITNLITKSNSKNKINNIIVNIQINKTPIKSNKYNIKKVNYTTNQINNLKMSSQKNISLKTINISLNKNRKKYYNINPINIFNSSNNISPKKIFSVKTSLINKTNNKKYLTKNISKKISRNNTLTKVKIFKEKNKNSISPDYITTISSKKKITNKNMSNKYTKKNIEIFITNIK